jgi:hypothetical protein
LIDYQDMHSKVNPSLVTDCSKDLVTPLCTSWHSIGPIGSV